MKFIPWAQRTEIWTMAAFFSSIWSNSASRIFSTFEAYSVPKIPSEKFIRFSFVAKKKNIETAETRRISLKKIFAHIFIVIQNTNSSSTVSIYYLVNILLKKFNFYSSYLKEYPGIILFSFIIWEFYIFKLFFSSVPVDGKDYWGNKFSFVVVAFLFQVDFFRLEEIGRLLKLFPISLFFTWI